MRRRANLKLKLSRPRLRSGAEAPAAIVNEAAARRLTWLSRGASTARMLHPPRRFAAGTRDGPRSLASEPLA
jgi:hypothetical protein